jgi:hypothetical protein
MTVLDLIQELQRFPQDMPITIQMQRAYPLEVPLLHVVQASEMIDEEGCCPSAYRPSATGKKDGVYLVAGEFIQYGIRDAWNEP